MTRLWQVLSIDVPWAISNWLWANIVSPLLAGLRQVTLRGIARVAVFLIIVWFCAQAFPPDLAVAFAGDTTLYFEIVSFAYLAIVRGQAYRAVRPAAQMLRAAMQRSGRAVIRVAARTRRLPRLPRVFDKSDADDVPDGAFTFT